MSVDILGTSWDQCRSMVQHSFTSTETRRLARTYSPGRPPRLSHNSWALTPSPAFSRVYITLPFPYAETGKGIIPPLTFTRSFSARQMLSAAPAALSTIQTNGSATSLQWRQSSIFTALRGLNPGFAGSYRPAWPRDGNLKFCTNYDRGDFCFTSHRKQCLLLFHHLCNGFGEMCTGATRYRPLKRNR